MTDISFDDDVDHDVDNEFDDDDLDPTVWRAAGCRTTARCRCRPG